MGLTLKEKVDDIVVEVIERFDYYKDNLFVVLMADEKYSYFDMIENEIYSEWMYRVDYDDEKHIFILEWTDIKNIIRACEVLFGDEKQLINLLVDFINSKLNENLIEN